MKYIVYRDINTPICIINDQLEIFHIETGELLPENMRKEFISKIEDWKYPNLRCINHRTKTVTTTRALLKKSLEKIDLFNQEIKSLVDKYRHTQCTEKNIADELGISTKTLQRHYPKHLSFLESYSSVCSS